MGAIHQALLGISGAGGAPPAPDDPTTIADLQLWNSARLITGFSEGDPLSPWVDSSGNGRDATSSGGNRPIYHADGGANNQPWVEFDGNTQQLDLPNFLTGFTAGHIFIVVKVDADPPASHNGPPVGAWSFVGGNQSFYPLDTGVIWDNWASTARKIVGDPTPSLTSWRVYEMLSKSANWTAWLDGTQIFTTGTNTVQFGTGPKIGVNSALSNLDGGLEEIIFFSAEKTGADKLAVKDYLAYWYALTIA